MTKTLKRQRIPSQLLKNFIPNLLRKCGNILIWCKNFRHESSQPQEIEKQEIGTTFTPSQDIIHFTLTLCYSSGGAFSTDNKISSHLKLM